jgi:ATP-binding cassette, subfamily B, bacterial
MPRKGCRDRDREIAVGRYRRAMSYFAPDRVRIMILVGLIGVSVCVSLLEAWPIAILIDTVLTDKSNGDWIHRVFLSVLPESRLGQIVALVVFGAALQVTGYTVWMGRMMISAQLKFRGTARVRFDLFSKLQSLGLTYHRGHAQGDATYRLTTDVAGPWGVMELAIGTGVAAVTLVVMTAILLTRSQSLTLAAFAVAPLIVASNWYFARLIHHHSLTSKQADADLTSLIQQSISTVALAQAFRRESHEYGRFQASVKTSNDAALRLTWQEQLYPLARDTILALSAAMIFGYGGYLVYRDQYVTPTSGGMTVGALLIFIDYTRKLWDPMKWVTEFVAKVQFHLAASERVFKVLDTPTTPAERVDAQSLPLQPRPISIERVGFGFGPDRTILHNVSARIQPGEMVAFVGPSGTGKSTLLNLMLRFYDPAGGTLRLGGVDYRDIKVADLRQHMALVGQDSAILPLSVAENIAYGRPDATRDEIVAAAQMADAAEFVAELPSGYDTVLAEGGQNLSGGQRQRIAIARALLSNAPILILDEPTSALDPQHEKRLVRTLRSLKRERTIVLVTHRLESTVDCDQIYVMEGGRIVEQGSHRQLVEGMTRYAHAWNTMRVPDRRERRLGDATPEPKYLARSA